MKTPYPTREDVFRAFAEHVSPGKVKTFERFGFDPVMGERAGARFFDTYSDRSWYNCHCNGGLYNFGHRHPELVATAMEALGSLDIGNHHLVSGWRARLAERLAATTDGRLTGAVFGVGGGEAVDLALKLARGHTGRSKIVSARGGYHGHTGLALATGDAQYRDPFGANLEGFVQVPFDDREAIDEAVDEDTAAVILEPVPATLGMPIASPGYLAHVEATCRARGALFVLDEVQTGLGRTGAMWCHQLDGLTPDMVVTGKGLSGGLYPITATLMTPELLRFFEDRPFVHVSTFGGAEIGCAIALKVLDLLEAPGFLTRVETVGQRFADGFADLPFEVRRRGLMMGLRFAVPDAGLMASKLLYEAGVFATWANNDTAVLQFMPPLNLTDAQADEIIAIVRQTFS